RVPGCLERSDRPLLLGILIGGEPQISKHAVIAVDRRRAQRLGVDRHDPLAELAGRFGKKLLEPGAEIGDTLGGDDSHLVAPAALAGSEDRAENHSRVLYRWCARGTGPHHLSRAFKDSLGID